MARGVPGAHGVEAQGGQEIGRGLAENCRKVQGVVGHGLAVGVRCHGPEDLRVSGRRVRGLGGLKASVRQGRDDEDRKVVVHQVQVQGGEGLKVAVHRVPYRVDGWGFADEESVEGPYLGAWETAYRPRFQVGSSAHAHKGLEVRRGTGLGGIEIVVFGD